jgi:hypothetical protein
VTEISQAQREYLQALPATDADAAEALDKAEGSLRRLRYQLRQAGFEFVIRHSVHHVDHTPADYDTDADTNTDTLTSEDEDTDHPDLDVVAPADAEPDPSDLSDRQKLIAHELQTGSTVTELSDTIDEREAIVTEHLRDLKRQGWQVYHDDTADMVAIEGDHSLRSSEHKGTRTRKANRWWESTHNALVRQFRGLSTPEADTGGSHGSEDWVTHLTDLHAGDRVRNDTGTVVYETDEIPDIIEYITQQSLDLADKHDSDYDTVHLLWGGDFLTNEGVYESQFEDLDAWLASQHDALITPLIRQIKTFASAFPEVNIVAQVGNHGQHRASGTSRQANADLILYKSIRNTVAELQRHSDTLDNVTFQIGDATNYKNFELRGGKLSGHLRHGQHRHPQAETSARKKQWLSTLLEHEFDLAYMGHYHISGVVPWDGPPVLVSPSPKPSGEFVERIGGGAPSDNQGVATCHGVSDEGITGVYPVDTRNYRRAE